MKREQRYGIKSLSKDFPPELLNEKKGGRYFFPKHGAEYWYIMRDGLVACDSYYDGYDVDRNIILQGTYRTEEEAKLASAKQRAIVACWKWAQENAPFEPDWGNRFQTKWDAVFNHQTNDLRSMSSQQSCFQNTLPYFKSEKDCDSFINANKEHLELLFNK